jgi:carbonic anhydrase
MSKINGFVGRRDFLKLVGLVGIGTTAHSCSLLSSIQPSVVAEANPANPQPVSADEALKRLLDGNQRFLSQTRKYPHQSLEHLRLVAQAQYPFASILGCADSRVPAEIIFDQGLGDLFIVRIAGNIVNDMTIGSLEYSTSVLGSQLIVVLGHRGCGAVAGAIKNEPLPGKIGYVVESIKPAIAKVKFTTGDIYQNAVIANIQYQTNQLSQKSKILAQSVRGGKLKIIGACYDINTGKITLV